MNDTHTPAVTRELKVKLAHRLLVELHARKVLHNKHIQEMVTEALDAYFVEHPAPVFPTDTRESA